MLSPAEELALVGEDFTAREELRVELFNNGEHLQTVLEEGWKLKKFPEVYKKNGWSNLKAAQVAKVRRAWGEMDAQNKERILTMARQRGQLQQSVSSTGATRKPNVTVHEKIRLMHLRVNPGAATIWSDFLGVKSRPVLDAAHSHESAERETATNPLTKLAEIFNDYEAFRPQNPVCQYNERQEKLMKNRNADKISNIVFDSLKGLYPNASTGYPRDGEFIKDVWMEIKRELTLVENSFHRSGNHQGDYQSKIGIESWVVDFAGDLYTKYAIVVLDQGLLSSLGKAMEFGTGRDTGVLVGTSAAAEALGLTTNLVAEGKNGQLIKDSSAERKRRRHQQRERENNEGQELSKKRNATHEMLPGTETGFTQASEDFNPQRMMALEILFKNCKGKYFAMAEKALASMAFSGNEMVEPMTSTDATPPPHFRAPENESVNENESEHEDDVRDSEVITIPFI